MKRTATMTYQTNGSSALAAQRAEFTVIEGNRRAAANRQVVQEHLSVAQMLKTGFVIVAVLAALAITSVLSDRLETAHFNRIISEAGTSTITVHTGDSLWDIAEDHAPEGAQTDLVVRWIRQANGLENATIVSGQTLVVPNSTL